MQTALRVVTGIAAMVAVTTAHSQAGAADAAGDFALRGYGSKTCQTLNTEISDATHAANYGSWLMGYATARNRLQSDTFDLLPFPDGMIFMRAVAAVCADQPAITVEQAADEIIRAAAPLHQRATSPVVMAEHAGRTLAIRQGALVALQKSLSGRGLFAGPANGEWTKATAAAVAEFQKTEKITVTGLPDLSTLFRALLPKTR